jgi:hypothetical protein
MNKKYFDLIESTPLSKEEIAEIEQDRQKKLKEHSKKVLKKNEQKLKELPDLRHVHGRVIITIDLEGKNSHTFASGEKIYIGRQFNNLNRRETEPVNAIVVSGEGIEKGAEILIHPNAIQPSNKIFDYNEDDSDVKYYSIREADCFFWKDMHGEWLPLTGFVTALRVYEPYNGSLVGIEPKKIKNVLYICSGELSGKVVRTLNACDYEIIFMGSNGQEERIIRCRHFEGEINEREEIVGIDENLTNLVHERELLIGNSPSNAKYLIFTL